MKTTPISTCLLVLVCHCLLLPDQTQGQTPMLDVDDDPENLYSGAPMLDWDFHDNRMHVMMKWVHIMPQHRDWGVDYANYYNEGGFVYNAASARHTTIIDPPLIPQVITSPLGKINRIDSEKPAVTTMAEAQDFQSHYTNVIIGGGAAAEIDDGPMVAYNQYYGKLPVGGNGRAYPRIWQDYLESCMSRAPGGFMTLEANQDWSMIYASAEQGLAQNAQQLSYRHDRSLSAKMVSVRSAFRQYPDPLRIQFSGQPGVNIDNLTEVQNNGATPFYSLATPPANLGIGYGKSYALSRQMLYYSWLQGARIFMYEGGSRVSNDLTRPSPLGQFEVEASQFIDGHGQPGPLDTPVAVISEFTNTWTHPRAKNGLVTFETVGEELYAMGDHQLHGFNNFFMPGYIQSEKVYESSLLEKYALPPTPYGDCSDYLHSNVRKEALSRYDLLIWGGIPPRTPSIVRDKFDHHVNVLNRKVLVFGSAAKSIYPELFAPGSASLVSSGATITYKGANHVEQEEFTLYSLASTDGMNVLGTVNGQPLVVEKSGVVIVLSDYGMNRVPHASVPGFTYVAETLITDFPHRFLSHAELVLNDLVGAVAPFRVGNVNHDSRLHFLVNRKSPGVYLIGLFNDSMESQEFTITSQIGTIQSLTEINLGDNKQDLKSAANGGAYAPPGLRAPENLPINYGPSDASHIEGRDFRLFQVTVNETPARPFSGITFPQRPQGTVLRVAGLDDIRHYMQDLPSFFQIFEGIQVGANSLAGMDDTRLAQVGFYLKRRDVRVVVDAEQIADEAVVIAALGKLALIDVSEKNLIMDAPSSAIQSAATAAEVTILASSAVNRMANIDDVYAVGSSLNVLDLHYVQGDEEGIYQDWKHFRYEASVTELNGKTDPLELHIAPPLTAGVNGQYYYIGKGIHNLGEVLSQNQAAYSQFSGLMIDAGYLRGRSNAQLQADKLVLDQLGLDLIVDLRAEQSVFDGVAYFPYLPCYESGLTLYTSILDKMGLLGSTKLIVALMEDLQTGAAELAERETTLGIMQSQAAARNINLHLIIDNNQTTAIISSNNVFVMKGAGSASPLKLVGQNGTVGNGGTSVYMDTLLLHPANQGASILLDASLANPADTWWRDVFDRWDAKINTSSVFHVENSSSAYPGITSAFEFTGGTNLACDGTSFGSMSGVDLKPVTIELWFKPRESASYPSNGQVLWETGGGTGLGIFYRNGFVEVAHDFNASQISADVSDLTDEFIQVVVTFDPTTTTNNFKLYINGQLKATASRTDTDWSSADKVGIGSRGGNDVGGAGNAGNNNTESFNGMIAIFRVCFDRILTVQEIGTNFESVAGAPNTAPVFTSDPISKSAAQIDVAYSGTLVGNATDADNDPLTFAKVSGPAWLNIAGNGTLSGTPALGDVGYNAWIIRATDSHGAATTSTLEILVSPYHDWALGSFANPFVDTAPNQNPDGDALTNLLEFAFGTDPTSSVIGSLVYVPGGNVTSAGTPILQNFAAAGQPAEYHAVFLRRKDYTAAGLSYTVLFSADLSQWTSSATNPSLRTGAGSTGEMEAVSVPFPTSVSLQAGGSAPPKFFRIGISSN